MCVSDFRPVLLATVFALSGCGGGGGALGSASSLPPPTTPATPASTAIIPAATTSQQFAVMGETYIDGPGMTLDPNAQIKLRYDASSQSYEAMLPDGQDWQEIHQSGTSYQGASFLLWLGKGDYQYSRLFAWNDGNNSGMDAAGLATPTGGMPLTGTASYLGQVIGLTSEHHGQDFTVDGSIRFSFDFGAGTLSGGITPHFYQDFEPDALGTISFRDTVYATESTTFSGKFDTNSAGVNSFSGLFTGPNAQELIGNFAFPYKSPIDGLTYQADGAFVGGK